MNVHEILLPDPEPIDTKNGVALVWTIPVRDLRPEQFHALTAPERAAAHALTQSAQRRYVTGRAALRTILSDRLRMRPNRVPIRVTDSGKPVIYRHDEIGFNLSHASDWVAIALAESGQIGIDIERVRIDAPLIRLAARFGPYGWAEELAALPLEEAAFRYWRWWVGEEAAIKARGERLSNLLIGGERDNVEITPVPAPPGYAAALASVTA